MRGRHARHRLQQRDRLELTQLRHRDRKWLLIGDADLAAAGEEELHLGAAPQDLCHEVGEAGGLLPSPRELITPVEVQKQLLR